MKYVLFFIFTFLGWASFSENAAPVETSTTCVTDDQREEFRKIHRLDLAERILKGFQEQTTLEETEMLKSIAENYRQKSISVQDERENPELKAMGVDVGKYNSSLWDGWNQVVISIIDRYWENYEGTVYDSSKSVENRPEYLIALLPDPWTKSYRAPVVVRVSTMEGFDGVMKPGEIRGIHIERDPESGVFDYTILVSKHNGNIKDVDWFESQDFYQSIDSYLESKCQ